MSLLFFIRPFGEERERAFFLLAAQLSRRALASRKVTSTTRAVSAARKKLRRALRACLEIDVVAQLRRLFFLNLLFSFPPSVYPPPPPPAWPSSSSTEQNGQAQVLQEARD